MPSQRSGTKGRERTVTTTKLHESLHAPSPSHHGVGNSPRSSTSVPKRGVSFLRRTRGDVTLTLNIFVVKTACLDRLLLSLPTYISMIPSDGRQFQTKSQVPSLPRIIHVQRLNQRRRSANNKHKPRSSTTRDAGKSAVHVVAACFHSCRSFFN